MSNKLVKELSRILDLPAEMVERESKSKLEKTYMILNGELFYVECFDFVDELCIGSFDVFKKTTSEVNSLDVWLPETGIYITKKGVCVFLSKLPTRQWARSCSLKNYNVSTYNDEPTSFFDIFNGTKVDFFVTKEGKILNFFRENIGYIQDENTAICTDSRYCQELFEWKQKWKQK